MKRASALALIALVVLASSCGEQTPAPPTATPSPDGVVVRFDGSREAEIRAELAVTAEEMQRGLMFREDIAPNAGMLFLYQLPDSDGFYMKNTLIPLSIAYMRSAGGRRYRVVAIRDMEPCPRSVEDCPTYPPGAYYDAALEVNQGWFADAGVKVGTIATVHGDLPNPFDLR